MYSHVVLGGTFDHLHSGHKNLLSLAFTKGRKVTLGLTKASMNGRKYSPGQIQPYAIREREIISFVKDLGRIDDLHIIPISDIYGSTLIDATLEAIIVTTHTVAGARQINEHRNLQNLPELTIEICPLHEDTTGTVLSSSRIRQGLTDRNGNAYSDLFITNRHLCFRSKELLHRPFGKAVGAKQLKSLRVPLVVVGDVVTKYCIQHKVPFSHAYIDGFSRRKPYVFSLTPPYTQHDKVISNSAGVISKELADFLLHLQEARNVIVRIDGEEDLVTVAAVLLLPLGTNVVYGYPYAPQSMRMITISDTIKQKFVSILQEI